MTIEMTEQECDIFCSNMEEKPNENWIRFGRWVFEKREALGIRQEDLAEKIGRDRQTIYRTEAGRSTKRPTVIAIANALGEDPAIALQIAFSPSRDETHTPTDEELIEHLSVLPDSEKRELLEKLVRTLMQSYRQSQSKK